MAALDVVVLLPAPSDANAFDADAVWNDISKAVQPLVARGSLSLERVQPASENGLKQRLARGGCTVLHFVGSGSSRAAAQYGTLLFEDSAGRARGINANHLATMLKQHNALQLLVLQACQKGDDPLRSLAEQLIVQGLPAVVSTPSLDREAVGCFARVFYEALLTESGERAVERSRDALVHLGNATPRIQLHANDAGWRLKGLDVREDAAPLADAAPPRVRREPVAATTMVSAAPTNERAIRLAAELRITQALDRKRAAGEFDVFLCHNGADKPAVKAIAQRLKALGVMPWLDEWELRPGLPWQRLLEQQIDGIRSAAVFVGGAGIGPWQQQEIEAILSVFASRQCPVIPVLLDNAPAKPKVPLFLNAMTWVDFRLSDPDPVERLVWGITGTRAVEH